MAELLTVVLLLLLLLFFLAVWLGRGGAAESLAGSWNGRGLRLSLYLAAGFLIVGLLYRGLFYLNDERESWITSGREPGDAVSLGYHTKARFRALNIPLPRVFDRNGFLLAGYAVSEGHLRRVYPTGDDMAHIVGYWTGPIRDGTGVEKGLVLTIGEEGESLDDVSLSIDLRLQQEALDQLDGRTGAIVVSDVRTGEILAAASLPTYNPNLILDRDTWREYVSDGSRRRLVSRAIREDYSPGSSIKPIIAAAALHLGVPLPEEEGFVCTGSYEPADDIAPITDRGHGRVDLEEAIQVSCNTYFARLAYEDIGFDQLVAYLQQIGFNRRLAWNTELALNQRGVLPIAASRVEAADEIARTRIGIGHAAIRVNPVHAAVLAGGIATGGRFYQPSIELGIEPDTLAWPLQRAAAERVAAGMEKVTGRGGTTGNTFIPLKNLGVTVFGKTGTVDRESARLAPAWFNSFGIRGSRGFAVTVVVADRNRQLAGSLVAPMARRMYDALARLGYFNEPEVTEE